MATRLELEAVTVRFADGAGSTEADALHAVSLSVDSGAVLAVLGSSGSGKSTMLRVIAGLTAPTSGRVLLDGVDATSEPTHRRQVGMMFQDHVLFPHLDVMGNVTFGLRVRGDERRRAAVRGEAMLESVGLGGFGARAVSSLSGGERQRVALARALAPSPRVLLLDEPMGSLDRVLRQQLVEELAETLRSLAMTAIYVTHDHTEAARIADDLVILDRGRIVQQGTPAAVADAPVDEHVARLMGVAPGR